MLPFLSFPRTHLNTDICYVGVRVDGLLFGDGLFVDCFPGGVVDVDPLLEVVGGGHVLEVFLGLSFLFPHK